MLASKSTSGLRTYAIIEFEAPGRNCAAGGEGSSASASARTSAFSNRFFGLSAEPRPLKPDGFFIFLSGGRCFRRGRRRGGSGCRRSRRRGLGGRRGRGGPCVLRPVGRRTLQTL